MVAKPSITLNITSYIFNYLNNTKICEESQGNQECRNDKCYTGTQRLRHEYEYLERCNRECCIERNKIIQQNNENYYGKLRRKDDDDKCTKQM
uniref:Uncharacterized protein n=1 Tax=Strongyloides venezuelensis TaxID=75913 RepID=A0A0K0FPX8_STRVS